MALGVDRELFVVDWGDFVHLVPLRHLQAFCDAYNQGVEPEHNEGRFLKARAGGARVWPSLPAPWGSFLRTTRGHGTVTALLAEGRATISLGRTDGLKIGDGVTARASDPDTRCALVVVALADRTATVKRLDPDSLPPEPGWSVEAPWRAAQSG